ncbi:hypothetical protein K504DRAFT_445483 [Pleomassaria siparia CBS 279.74]|uniref:Uncharacterized protein n=1 Tax=Pleomassaria siparia CBS 279.74 TaxID=1314801 RepID=A0A6G1KQ20_9PLEO|nr:hypothetical protein K504DRAFT_445483 [Pleomassaria siparia CBS 279.74]
MPPSVCIGDQVAWLVYLSVGNLDARIYHQAMAKIFKCAIMADYAEQVLITGVKDGQHCVVCKLHKGIVKHSLDWLSLLIRDIYGKSSKNLLTTGRYKLDDNYRNVLHYPGLKIFNHTAYSRISQWTGNEQKAIIRQAVPYLKAICDFVILAYYYSYDEDTLSYLLDALKRIDTYKHELRKY